jgi:hypothetical protein
MDKTHNVKTAYIAAKLVQTKHNALPVLAQHHKIHPGCYLIALVLQLATSMPTQITLNANLVQNNVLIVPITSLVAPVLAI